MSSAATVATTGPGFRSDFNAISDADVVVGQGRNRGERRPIDPVRRLLRLALHIDGALEVRAIGDRYSGRYDVSFDRALFLDVHFLGRGQVTSDLPENDNRF